MYGACEPCVHCMSTDTSGFAVRTAVRVPVGMPMAVNLVGNKFEMQICIYLRGTNKFSMR
eukprot:SAG31_NODE_1045_length_10180_cov_5.454221_15_plen_60_part_00